MLKALGVVKKINSHFHVAHHGFVTYTLYVKSNVIHCSLLQGHL